MRVVTHVSSCWHADGETKVRGWFEIYNGDEMVFAKYGGPIAWIDEERGDFYGPIDPADVPYEKIREAITEWVLDPITKSDLTRESLEAATWEVALVSYEDARGVALERAYEWAKEGDA